MREGHRDAIAGERFVLSLGSWSSRLARPLGLDIPVYPVKGYSATVPIGGKNGAPSGSSVVAFALPAR